jgi:LacI family transcriptional regulator
MPQRITMADVAREAGVSLMTVSRVVNKKGEISESTRQRVQDVIDRLGYRPSDIARSLATDRTGTVGLVVLDNANPFFSELARGVEHVAYAEHYNVFLCNTEEDTRRELTVLRSLEEKRVDGVIICGSRLDDTQLRMAVAGHSAVVLVNRQIDANGLAAIGVDDVRGGRMATEHLIRSGRRAIGFVAGPERSYSGRQRARGYQAALAEAGLPVREGWQRHCLPIVESGRSAARDLLTAYPELDALFCYNDLNAVGALQACADLGLRIPDDIAIVGFDDIPLASLVTPSLTTCCIPKYELGRQAMQLLLAYINECYNDCENITLQPELIIRASAP